MRVELDEVIKFLKTYEVKGDYIEEPLYKDLKEHFKGQEFTDACRSKMSGVHD